MVGGKNRREKREGKKQVLSLAISDPSPALTPRHSPTSTPLVSPLLITTDGIEVAAGAYFIRRE